MRYKVSVGLGKRRARLKSPLGKHEGDLGPVTTSLNGSCRDVASLPRIYATELSSLEEGQNESVLN